MKYIIYENSNNLPYSGTICEDYTTNGLAQDCNNSIADTLELLQSCTKPLIHDGCDIKLYNENQF